MSEVDEVAARLLLYAERAVECGLCANSMMVFAAPGQKTQDFLVIGRQRFLPEISLWESYENVLAQEEGNDTKDLNYLKSKILLSGTSEVELETRLQPTLFSPTAIGGGNQQSLNSDSPFIELPPKILFSDNAVGNSPFLVKSQGSTEVFGSESASKSKLSLQVIRESVTVFGGLRSVDEDVEICAQDADVIYYWITRTHRAEGNAALAFARLLSVDSNIPMIAVVCIDEAELHELQREQPHIRGGGRGSRSNHEAEGSTGGDTTSSSYSSHNGKRKHSLEDSCKDGDGDAGSDSQRPEIVLHSLLRRSATRLAALISIRKELLQMGVALVCIAHDAHSEQSEGADRMHTAAALCQALCCQDTLVVTSCSGNRADSQHDSSESTWGQQSGHRHCKRSVIVTDACDVPVRRLVCEQIAEGPGKSSMVISIDSSDLPKEYVEQCSAREDGIMELPAPSVSELASQLLEKVSCIPSARLVDLSHWEETVNAALARSGAGLEIPAESHSAMWSTARAHELLAWCRHTPSPLPDRVASWLLYYYDQGFLSMSDVMTHSEESSNGGDHSNSNTNASVSYCLKDAQQLVQEYALLQRNWRGRIAKEVRVLPQISSGFSGSVRDGCSGSAAGAARCHWATQWLDALSATTVANIQRIDALLPKRSASRARRALAEMRGAVSSCLMVNSTQRALVEHGVVPTQPRLYQWLCAYVLHLSSVEAAVRVGYVELATHSLCCFEASLFPVVAYLQAVEDVVRDIAHAGGEVLSEDNVVDAVKECIGVV